MERTVCEHALSRVLTYVSSLDLPITPEVSIEALRLVEEAMSTNAADPFGFVMERLPQRFRLPEISMPSPMPPIKRGSIGYGDYR